MGFTTDKEYLDYKESITDFLWKEVDPLVPEMEETNHIPKEILFPKFREKGLFGLIIPEEYGGMGLNTIQYLPILAELSKVSGAVRALIHVHLTTARAISIFGREEQKKELLPRIATGDLSVAFGITEANSGSGLDCKTTAVKRGDHYVLNGEKHLITNADFAKLFMVACYTRPRDTGREAMSALLTDYVPRDDGEQPEDGDSSEEDLLNAARKAIGSANLTVRCRPLEEQLWQLSLAGMPACGVEELKSVKAWPVTLQANSAVVCWTDPAVEDLPLGKVETQSVTGLIAFESTAPSGENRVRFVLNLPVDGMPEHRDAAIVAGVVSSEQKFLRYLRMLLGGLNDADGPGGGLMRRLSRALSGGGAGGLDEAPLLEELTRAFTRHPARLDAVSRLVEQLRSVPETANVLPERFLELWAIFEQAREGTS